MGIYIYRNTLIKKNQSNTVSARMNDGKISIIPISSNTFATRRNTNNQLKLPEKYIDNQPLTALAIEYQYAIKNHSQDISFSRFIQRKLKCNQLSENTFSNYYKNFLKDSSSNDLLKKSLAINVLIADMDQFDADVLLVKEQPHEILLLLAHDEVTTQKVQPQGLIQREHHMISLDSYFYIFSTTSDIS
ncbi:TagK domain-containing protein [Glaciimonas sp. GG7]